MTTVLIVIAIIDTFLNRCSSMHIGWVKDKGIEAFTVIGKMTEIYTSLEVGGNQGISSSGNVAPEDTLAVGYISNGSTLLHIERQCYREKVSICSLYARHDQCWLL